MARLPISTSIFTSSGFDSRIWSIPIAESHLRPEARMTIRWM
jgi:hypothetical protein